MEAKRRVPHELTYIDLFAGAGGLSEGFQRSGYFPIAHIEMDKDACSTLKTRLAYHHFKSINKTDVYLDYLCGNINRESFYRHIPRELIESVINCEIRQNNIKKIFKAIRLLLKNSGKNSVDIIVGGPPCQAYSLAGRSAKKDKTKDDHRNYLYKEYAKFLIEFRPKLFVFENVPGLITAEGGKHFTNLKKYFKRIGYNVEVKLLDASDFGVLQRRKRLIFIGWRKDMAFAYPDFEKTETKWMVKHIFNDLPILRAGEIYLHKKYRIETNDYLRQSGIRNGIDLVTQNITRPHNKKDLKIYRYAIELWEKESRRLKNNEIPAHDRTQKNVTSFLDRFKVVASNDLSHTLLAHIAKDGHYYIHPDKSQLRSISVREAARIQSFPDDYFFEGTRTSIFKQIGNAVPPLMAWGIAQKIKDLLRAYNF